MVPAADPSSPLPGAPSASPSSGPGFDLVIVHRGVPELVAETAASFLGQGVPVRIVVVDNGSPPAELDLMRRRLPEGVVVLPQGSNLGFGPAANVGLRRWLRRTGGHHQEQHQEPRNPPHA